MLILVHIDVFIDTHMILYVFLIERYWMLIAFNTLEFLQFSKKKISVESSHEILKDSELKRSPAPAVHRHLWI